VRVFLRFAAGVGVMLHCHLALAQKPTSQSTEYSRYEKETIARALEASGKKIDPAPEGKIIERIDTMRFEVLEDRDPIPDKALGIPVRKLLNSLHVVSRDYVIRRETLLHEGEPYQQVLVDETARNMRTRMPLEVSVVIIVGVVGSTPDKVGLLIITKDIWSLRLSYDLAVGPGGVESLLLVPQETNLLGHHHTLSTTFVYQPESYTFGAGYNIPRFGTSWIGAAANASIVINRRSGAAEGMTGALSVGQDLYSTLTKWAWGFNSSYSNTVTRHYVNANVATFNSPDVVGAAGIPYQYRSRAESVSVSLTRSFGWGIKNNFSLSFNAAKSSYSTFDLSAFNPVVAREFQGLIPIGEARVYPMLTWASFRNDYFRTLDIATLALQEDYRLGHDVSVSLYPVPRALGSSRDLVGVTARAAYSLAMGDGLVGATATAFAEDSRGDITDGSVGASFGAISPRTGFGRVVMNASFLNRFRNYLNAQTFAGGSDRLRGYPSNFFFGKDTLFYNLEFRSRSAEVLKCQVGGVVFYDVGDAAQGFNMLHAKQSVGTGVRILLPQLNRMVFRADIALPMQRGPFPETGIQTKVDPVGFYLSFGQAFTP